MEPFAYLSYLLIYSAILILQYFSYLVPQRENKSKRRKTDTKFPWSKEENQAINLFFKKNIENGRPVPNKEACLMAKQQYKILGSRCWTSIQAKVHNIISKTL